MKSSFLKKRDVVIIALLFALALFAFLIIKRPAQTGGVYASVNYAGDVVKRIYLNEDGVYNIDADIPVTLTVENGEIFFYNSQCRDHICERTFGHISEPGEYAICMPARVAVTIENDA